MKIVLLGFMGTGKTSAGKVIARKLNYSFCDTDEEIQFQEGCTIPEIFAERGEDYFRRRESQVLKELLSREDDLVVAAGGGIVKSAENRKILQEMALPVLLTAPPEIIYQRTEGGGRPLLEQSDRLKIIKELLEERSEYYREFTRQVDTAGRSKEEVGEEILKMIGVDDYDGDQS